MTRLHTPLIIPAMIVAAAAGCSSGSSGSDAEARRADSIHRADSLAMREAMVLDSLRADSMRRDSIRVDSIWHASMLMPSDFIIEGTNRFLNEGKTLDNLARKCFVTDSTSTRHINADSRDPRNTGRTSATDYRLRATAQVPGSRFSQPTIVTLRFSEPYSPIIIDFANDEERDAFIAALAEAGFMPDDTGNYTHPSNTTWDGAVITPSGRRVLLEWMWSY